MGQFEESIRNHFFKRGSSEAKKGTRVCLLDASGNAIGSDTIENIRKLVGVDSSKYVDMGLPSGTLWAKCNLGATSETGYGWYFSWGNPDAHPQGAGYNFDQTTYNATPAASIDGNLTMAQDAASMILGQNWRMPTKEHFGELFNANNTEYIDANGNVITGADKRTTVDGVTGLLIRSKANGNTLFFPAAGSYNGTTLGNEGSSGNCWSSSFISAASAYRLSFNSNGVNPQNNGSRHYGFSVRPVI